ncbi:MAG TPA: phosphatidylglycerophosphatase A [Acidisarcina sp.]
MPILPPATTESGVAAAQDLAAAARTRWAWVAGTFFGAGRIKPGPGTWGSVAALLLWCGLAHLHGMSAATLPWYTAGAAMAAFAVGIPAGSIVALEAGREDPQFVVIDEVVGQWIALIACPVDWKYPVVALLLFRVFDIVKPPPARQLESLHGGWGIMLDDVAAGLYALGVLQFVRHWL